MRAQKLYELYNQYESIDEIPAKEREKLEKQVFRNGLEEIWESTAAYFAERDPVQIERAESRPKRKMALIFRWYLGLSSNWSNEGTSGREMDYQIWCGPSMGAFNAWARGSHLEEVKGRKVADVAEQILTGAAFAYRVQNLANQGVRFPPSCLAYRPREV
jgi:PfaD family protein